MNTELESKIDVKRLLNVFQMVVDQGAHTDAEYWLNGLYADPGYDGYNVTLRDEAVTVNIQFHSQCTVDAPNAFALDAFIQRVKTLERQGKPPEAS